MCAYQVAHSSEQGKRRPRRDRTVTPLGVPEEWRPIPGYEGWYEASDQGRIRALSRPYIPAGGLCHPRKTSKGYLYVNVIGKDGRRRKLKVHRAVAAAFLGPCPPGQVVRHGPGGPSDNRLMNLAYGTHAQNRADIAAHWKLFRERTRALTETDAIEVHHRYQNGELPKRLAREYEEVMQHITNLLTERSQAAALLALPVSAKPARKVAA
jgi:hypothetical protein